MDEKITCLILDDEPLAREVIEHYVGKTPFLQLAMSLDNPLKAITYMESNHVDLLLTDIKMPQLNGLQLINSLSYKPLTILITAYRDFALESFESGVIDYLVKPVSYDRFLKAVLRAKELITLKSGQQAQNEQPSETIDKIFIKVDGKLINVRLDDIIFIESMRDYLKFYIVNDKQYVSYGTLKSMEEKFPEYFYRIQRSYIINSNHIQSFYGNMVRMINGKDLPISATLKQQIYDKLGIA